MAFKFPSYVLIPFPKLLALASRNTDGLMRGISEKSIELISSDMKSVGLITDKFGKPTINLSCDTTEANYRSFFVPVQGESVEILNEDGNILNLDGFPVLQIASHILRYIEFSDGRHRVISCNRAFGESVYDRHVLCSVTTFKDPMKMRLDSYKKSEERPAVFGSIHDALECIEVPLEMGLNLELLKHRTKMILRFSKPTHVDRFCKLLVHIFPTAKKLLDVHRDSSIFTQDCIFGSSGKAFVTLIQECGRLHLKCYRYVLSNALCDLKCKEQFQIKTIILCSSVARKFLGFREKAKSLLNIPKHLYDCIKAIADRQEKVELCTIPFIFADALRNASRDLSDQCSKAEYLEILDSLFESDTEVANRFLKSDATVEHSEAEDNSQEHVRQPDDDTDGSSLCNQETNEVPKSPPLDTGSAVGVLTITSDTEAQEQENALVVSTIDDREEDISSVQENDAKAITPPHLENAVCVGKNSPSADHGENSSPEDKDDNPVSSSTSSHEKNDDMSVPNSSAFEKNDDIPVTPNSVSTPKAQKVTNNIANAIEQQSAIADDPEAKCEEDLFQEIFSCSQPSAELEIRTSSLSVSPVLKEEDEQGSLLSNTTSSSSASGACSLPCDVVAVTDSHSEHQSGSGCDIMSSSSSEDSSPSSPVGARRSQRLKIKAAVPAEDNTKRSRAHSNSPHPSKKRRIARISKCKPRNTVQAVKRNARNEEQYKPPVSEKGTCALRCIRLSDKLLSRVVFIRLEDKPEGDVITRMDRLDSQSEDGILFVDQEFFAACTACELLSKLMTVTPRLRYVIFMTEIEGNSFPELDNQYVLASSVILETASSKKIFVNVYSLKTESKNWKGPKTVKRIYNSNFSVHECLDDTLGGLWSSLDIDMDACTIYDFLLSFEGLLRTPIRFRYQGFYFICLTKQQEDSGGSTVYLSILRDYVLKSCDCGGHALISADNESNINEYEGPMHSAVGPEKQPFSLSFADEDFCPFGEVFSHTRLLLRKDVSNNIPKFAEDDKVLCTKESNPVSGFALHRGAFISRKTADTLEKEDVPCDILFPRCFLVDTLSRMRHYENSLSPFEMRQLYVAGITHRKLWLFFSNRSTASLFNEGTGGGEIDFTPRYFDEDYIYTLYDKGITQVKERKMSLICCTLKPNMISKIPDRLRCNHCGAIELLTDYGNEYIHD